MEELDVTLTVRLRGDIKTAIQEIAKTEELTDSEVIRSIFTDHILDYEKGESDFLNDVKEKLKVKTIESRLKNLHKITSFEQRFFRKICYMLLYNDKLDKIIWAIDSQISKNFYFDSDRKALKNLSKLFKEKNGEEIFKLLKNTVEFERLKFKTLPNYDSITLILKDRLENL